MITGVKAARVAVGSALSELAASFAPSCRAFAAGRARAARAVTALTARTPTELDDTAWIGVQLACASVSVYLFAARILATSPELPLLLRILFMIGCVQVPVLPTDELALAIALAWLALFHRDTLRGALAQARARKALS